MIHLQMNRTQEPVIFLKVTPLINLAVVSHLSGPRVTFHLLDQSTLHPSEFGETESNYKKMLGQEGQIICYHFL